MGNLRPKWEVHFLQITQNAQGHCHRDPGFQIPRPGLKTSPEPPKHIFCAGQLVSCCGAMIRESQTAPGCPLLETLWTQKCGIWVAFIGHVAAQAMIWEHKRPGACVPGTEFEEPQRSGLFGARPQAAGERAEEEVLLAGLGELGQALLLLLL